MENHNAMFAAYNLVPVSYIPYPEPYFSHIQQMTIQIHQQNSQIAQLKTENENLKAFMRQSQTQKTSIDSKSEEMIEVHHSQSELKREKPQKKFYCEYENCDRVYASCLALNLHIKTKHNGGTKKERDAYAKLIALAQIKGLPRPQINFSFPKNYIENFKQKLLAEEKFQKIELQNDVNKDN